MKLFQKNAGTKVVNINGQRVKFINSVAEVEDEFGKEVLKLGLPDMFEQGTQPVFQTPKEVQLKSEFADRETWYQKELERLTNINTVNKTRIAELTAEVKAWKDQYEEEHTLRIKEASILTEKTQAEVVIAPAQETIIEETNDQEEITDEQFRKDLEAMKKDELIQFGTEEGIDMASMNNKTKAEIIDYLIEKSKE